MKKYQSVRNGSMAELVNEDAEHIVLKLETGEEKTINPATLKRWWKLVPEGSEDQEDIVDPEPETNVDTSAEEAIVRALLEVLPETPEEIAAKAANPKKTKPAKLPKATKEPKAPKEKKSKITGEHPLKVFLEELAIERGTEVFKATVPSFRSLKVGGRMYMAFTFNVNGITLWLRTKAIDGITSYNKMNHMFDARVHFAEDNAANRKMITKLLDASLKFQKEKLAKKAEKTK